MRILLDECIDQRLRLLLARHECQTAAYAGFAGLKNGLLLAAAENAGFEVMMTTDQEIPFQQNFDTAPRRTPLIKMGISQLPFRWRKADLRSSTTS